ncbi:MAG: hypothetical protein IJ091_02425 [Oscillospiraceae bacterium]|nr:hypothetical protein [Oscillospiraceae bacterium]
MRAVKKVIDHLNKCYAVAEFDYDGERHLISAAEKTDPCYVYNLDGDRVDTLWEGPGGVMTLCQYPLSDAGEPVLLATQKFYSPNNSAEAKIVYYTREGAVWKCNVLCDLPFVHRFGIVERNRVYYLVACTLKSAHAFKDDWTCPGRIWVAELPENIRDYDESNMLEFKPLVSGLFKNHGFCRCEEEGYSFVLVGTENGVYKVTPPASSEGEWSAECILDVPTSDMLYQDYDGDGEKELLILSPFHGDTLSVYKRVNGKYENVFTFGRKLPFLHAIWGATVSGKEYAFIGNRQADRELFALHYDGEYVLDVLDTGAGPANCMFYKDGEKNMLIASNRETDEVALYELFV